jgi:hypothetical protein
MIRLRTVVVSLLSLVAFVFATAGNAAPEKKLSVSMSPSVAAPSSITAFTATFKNETPNGNSSVNSLRLTLPDGFAVDTATANPSANWTGSVSWTDRTISISNMSPLKPLASFVLTFRAKVPALGASCPVFTWNAAAWTGSNFSGDTFRQLFPPELDVNSTTTLATALELRFQSLPSSVTVEGTYSFAVTQASANCTTTSLPPTRVTLSGDNGFIGGATLTTSGGTATFAGLKFPNPTPTTIVASADGYLPATATLNVFTGQVDCGPLDVNAVPPVGASFDASTVCGAPSVSLSSPGFAAGFRGPNKNGLTCKKVNASLTNNICGAPSSTKKDASGNDVPPKAVSFVWDTGFQPQAAFTYTLTWTPEFVDPATGLPRLQATQYCSAGGTTPCTAKTPLRACTSTEVAHSSIPTVPPDQPACIADESWSVVPASRCAGLAIPAGASGTPACVVVSTTVIDALDPVMIRD